MPGAAQNANQWWHFQAKRLPNCWWILSKTHALFLYFKFRYQIIELTIELENKLNFWVSEIWNLKIGLFSVSFCLFSVFFKANITIFTTILGGKKSATRNPWPLECKSPPKSTSPGLLPKTLIFRTNCSFLTDQQFESQPQFEAHYVTDHKVLEQSTLPIGFRQRSGGFKA